LVTYTASNIASAATVDFSTQSRSRDNLWDWDVSFFKGECAANEAVTGVAQTQAGKVDAVRCTQLGNNYQRQICYTRAFSGGNNQGSTAPGDWAQRYNKGECGPGEIVKGVSADTSTGAVHAIFCCTIG
jgi:hypothetical protein